MRPARADLVINPNLTIYTRIMCGRLSHEFICMEREMNQMKRCKQCEQLKPLSQYHRHKATKDRLQTHCKDCGSKAMALARAQERVVEAYQTLHRREELLCGLIDEFAEVLQ